MGLRRLAGICFALCLGGCSLVVARPRPAPEDERLRLFPTRGLPLEKEVSLTWNAHLVPFVEARHDSDAAFTLGLVHAHLRLGQMEILRRVATGRLAEMGGPFAADIDKALRILDLDKATDAMAARLPHDTRQWTQRFVDGINWVIEHQKKLPLEFRVLDLDREPWTVQDVLRVGRLASADLSWAHYLKFLRLAGRKGWRQAMNKALALRAASVPSFTEESQGPFAKSLTLLHHLSRSGSNSLAIAGERSRHGAALIANDPHLGIFAPNFWLIAGYRSPSYEVVGLMIPGLPFVAVGRNRRIAWGGTNMRSISSHLYRISTDLPIRRRRERIGVRWIWDEKMTIRDTPAGPVISDAPFYEGERQLALSWRGHRESDELSAFLAANRAHDWAGFRQAFKDYAVSGQNMLYADSKGNIGQLLAYAQPILKDPSQTLALTKTVDNPVVAHLPSPQLPLAYNPPAGFLASANNLPAPHSPPIAFAFAGNDRIDRLQELAGRRSDWDVSALQEVQQDTYSASSHRIKTLLVSACDASMKRRLAAASEDAADKPQREAMRAAWRLFKAWDGRYRAVQRGPIVFEATLRPLASTILRRRWPDKELRAVFLGADLWKASVLESLTTSSLQDRRRVCGPLVRALESGVEALANYSSWGAMHRLRLQHPLGLVPWIGSRYQLLEYGADGSNDTLLKGAHSFSGTREEVYYGACARHISDLSDIDANYFVLLGGQDGWLRSPFMSDQVKLWRHGRLMQVPLSHAAIERWGKTKHRLRAARGK